MRSKNELRRECDRVNEVLRKEAEKESLGTKKSLARMEDARHNDNTAFSFWAQLEFCEICRRELEKQPAISASYLINTGARRLRLSSTTTKRYLAVLRSQGGPLSSLGDIIMLNPNYTEQDTYWKDDPADQKESEEE